MRVTFVLPGAANAPTGGARMVLRYANALACAGDSVTVMMPPGLRSGSRWRMAARRGRYLLLAATNAWSPRRWMTVDERVRLFWLPNLAAGRAPAGDAVIATAVQTAEAVAGWPAAAGRKFYLVQGYETWDFPAARVQDSWRLPFRKLAVSHWLCDLIAAAGAQADYLPNGLDHDAFGCDLPPEQRQSNRIIWPYHPNPMKGAADVLAVLEAMQAGGSKLEVHAFGSIKAPVWPVPVVYHRLPGQSELRRIYNEAAIAIAPSHTEGWGLPACEALQCGCALAASDIGGHREFLRDGKNALLHRPGDLTALRNNLERLLADAGLRSRLGRQGGIDMMQWQFKPRVEQLRRILREGADA